MSERSVPTLNHQLELRADALRASWFKIVPRRAQRAMQFVVLWAKCIVFVVLVLAAIFLPDYLFDYSQRGDAFGSFFFKFLGVAAAIVFVLAFGWAMKRVRVIYVNDAQGRILESGLFERVDYENALEIAEIERLEVEKTRGILTKSVLNAVVKGQRIPVIETYGGDEDLAAVRDWLFALRRVHGAKENGGSTHLGGTGV